MNRTARFRVPIFDVSVAVVVTDDIPAAYLREFGVHIGDTQMACLGYDKSRFGLFLEPAAVRRREVVAHELFHLTHRVLERCCMNFDEGHHEVGAYLNEWLTKRVFEILERRRRAGGKKKKSR